MTIDELQVLVEVDEGEFHTHQGNRSAEGRRQKHAAMSDAFDRLRTLGYIRSIGDEFHLTNEGNDLILLIRRATVLEQQ